MIITGVAVAATIIMTSVAYPALSRLASAQKSVSIDRLRIASVERKSFVRDVSVRGKVVAAISPTLYAPARGTVSFRVMAGDSVKVGDVLADVVSPDLISEFEQEQSALQSMEVELDRTRIDIKQQKLRNQQTIDLAEVAIKAAERELNRAEESIKRQVISQRDYEKAQDDLATAKLEYTHAIQDSELANERLTFEQRTQELTVERQRMVATNLHRRADELTVRSPVNGLVGNLEADEREVVEINSPLVTVMDLTALEVELEIPESYADSISPGMPVDMTLGGDAHLGVLVAISPEVERNQVTARVRFDPATPDGLIQNQQVSARVVLESRDQALVLRRGPFLDAGGGRIAYVVEDELAHRRPIEIGAVSIGEVEILAGLEPGDRVIVSGTESFESSETILIAN